MQGEALRKEQQGAEGVQRVGVSGVMESLVLGTSVCVDEDAVTEFKAHRDLSIEELPAWASEEKGRKLNRSRQPISKTLCGFLNSRKGGTVWMGLGDSGRVDGLRLSAAQKDHVRLAVRDLLGRYDPPVPLARVRLAFVPVRGAGGRREAWEDDPRDLPEHRRLLIHTLRSPTCVCDGPKGRAKEAKAAAEVEEEAEAERGLWVIQLEVVGSADLTPVFRNEEGLVYARCLSSNIQLNAEAIADIARLDAHNEPHGPNGPQGDGH